MELVAFFRQLGLALAGASSLWGLVYAIKSLKNIGEKREVYERFAKILFFASMVASLVAISAWFIIADVAGAHEGITLIPTSTELTRARALTNPLFVIWVLGLFIANLIFSKKKTSRGLIVFFSAQLALVLTIISIPAWTGMFGARQLFFTAHGFHSIMTLGTVLTLDILFYGVRHKPSIARFLAPIFPTLSKVIWVGLGIDFLSVGLIFPEALVLSDKFFFSQTVVGILILNGVFLSGPLTRKMIALFEIGKNLPPKLSTIATISGTISIISWTTITFVDFFKNLTLPYFALFGIYLTIIATSVCLYVLFEHKRVQKIRHV